MVLGDDASVLRAMTGSDAGAAAGPLAGVRVLDLTSVIMGPFATQILGDLGADVITVESAKGDTSRRIGPGPTRQLSDIALNLLRNKRNIGLDLKAPSGREAFLRIAATCDVFVTNLRPTPIARLGLDYESVKAVRPDIIYCSANGFPSDSGRADEPAYDDVIQGAVGVPDVVQRSGGGPALLPTIFADKVSGLTLVYAVLAALFHRERTGEGQRVEVPMVEAATAFLLVEHGAGAVTSGSQVRAGYQRVLTPHRKAQRTLDGLVVVFPYLQEHWDAMCSAGGEGELVGDPRYSVGALHEDPGRGYAMLERVIARRTTAEWLEFCAARGIPATRVPTLEETVDSLPAAVHPTAGPYKQIPPPVRFGRTPMSDRRPAPLIGEHNSEVLAEVGYSGAEIAQLTAEGAVRSFADGRRRSGAVPDS